MEGDDMAPELHGILLQRLRGCPPNKSRSRTRTVERGTLQSMYDLGLV